MRAAITTPAVLGAAAGFMAWAVRGRSSEVFAPSVWRGVRERPAIALTFDDGPSESTPELLRILDIYGVRATFFQCGANVRRLPHIARAVADAGHEIANHTFSHQPLWLRGPAFIWGELAETQKAIEEVCGVTPTLFRAPFGVRWPGLREAQRRLGLTGVMWSTIGVDWKLPIQSVVTRLLRGAGNGAIFCLHDGRVLEQRPDIGVTLRSIEQVLPILIQNGFHFEKVSDILCPTTN
jgi:peptidoglycan/xylan/chitin deacetylase (PgdA/CDA1 family)